MEMYNPILIKDRLPNKKGDKYGPITLEGYKSLYDEGYIDDELGLFKKKQNTKKSKEENNEE